MPDLDSNMGAGLAAIMDTRKNMPNSMNYQKTSSPVIMEKSGKGFHDGKQADIEGFRDARNEVIDKLRKAKANSKMTAKQNLTLVNDVYNLIRQNKTGNCMELAFYCAKLLQQKKMTVDIVQVKTVKEVYVDTDVVPHWFVVLGRNKGSNQNQSDIGLPNTWGEDAVVVDAWDTTCYPASRYTQFWDGLNKAANNNELTCKLWFRI